MKERAPHVPPQEMGAITFTNLTREVEIGANSYCLEVAGKRIVLDSGLHPRFEGEQALPQLGLLPDDSVDAVILSHAHQDHLGSIPVLMRRHPRAPVFMTEATRLLSDVMLHNSVNVMLKKRDDGVPNYPLFSHREVDGLVRRWQTVPLHQRFDLNGERLRIDEDVDVSIEFYDAGHILGSVGTMIRSGGRSIFYTGDVQFDDQTIMQAARFPEEPLDVLIIETTRGDRATPEGFTRQGEEQRLGEAIRDAFAQGGAVMIPVFALGKTQELMAMCHEFRRRGLLGFAPIYIGGLGTKLTEIYDRLARHAPRQKHDLQILDTVAPFTMAGKAADETPLKAGRIYALSSGMMTEKTLSNSYARKLLSDPQQSLFFVGYADPLSPAGKLIATPPGENVQVSPDFPPQPLNCKVDQFNFSAHASRETLREYVGKVRPKKVILVHGDRPAIEWFRETLQGDLPESEIITPTPGVALEL
jgi:Cft2 family RNA processing exonuclease